MKTVITALFPVVLVCLLPSAAPAGEVAAAPGSPSFSGQWNLNETASDNIQAVMMRAMGERTGGMGGSDRGMGGGRGGGMGRPGGDRGRAEDGSEVGGSPSSPGGDRAEMQARRKQEMARLEIFTDRRELNITDGLDVSRLLYCDGREVEIWTERGKVTARASCEGNKLVETRTGDRGGPTTFTYTLAAGGNQLFVTEERPLPGRKERVKLNLVYDRAP